jgi:hypothetical protein
MIRRAIAITLLLLTLTPAVAMAQGQSPAAATLSRCVQTTGRLDVIFMIDEHQSIGFTDPLGLRVDGVDAAIAGFERLAQTPIDGQAPTIKVLLEGFGGIVIPSPTASGALSDWMRLDAGTLTNVLAAANEYRSRHAIEDTDFALALSAARTLLAREAVAETEAGGPPPCKALIWFTNGRYLITDRNQPFNKYTYAGLVAERGTPANPLLPLTEPYAPGLRLGTPGSGAAIQAAGTRYLCRPGGVMDGLQSDGVGTDGVVKFTFGLTQLMSPTQQDLLEALTSGRGGGVQCGSTLSPSAGQYLPIAQDRCLLFVFAGLLDGTGCPPPTTPVCAQAACERGLNAFRTLPGISSFLIRADTGASNIEIDLRGPDGHHLTVLPGSTTLLSDSGASIAQQWYSSRDVELTGTLPPSSGSWVGPWAYAFVDPTGAETSAVPISQVELTAGLTPRLAQRQVYRGTTTPLRLYFTDTTGNPVASGPLLADARPSASVTDSQTNQTLTTPVGQRQADGSYRVPLTVSAGSTSPYVLLSVEVPFAMGTGAAILPLRRTFELPVALPAGQGFPTVTPSSLNLPSINGNGTSTGALTIRASPNAGGCVWVTAPTHQSPTGTRSVLATVTPDATTQARCLPLAKGQSAHLRVSFTVHGATAGTMNVTVPVHLRSDLVGRSAVVTIGGSLALYPPRNIAKRVAILIVALLIGILIPLVVLYLLNWQGARFTPEQSLLRLALDIVVFPESRLEGPGHTHPEAPRLAFDWARKSGRDRGQSRLRLDLTPLARPDAPELWIELRGIAARRPKDLFTGASGEAILPGHVLMIGGQGRVTSSTGSAAADVPLRLPGTWMFAVERVVSSEETFEAPRLAEVHGRLLLLLSLSPDLTDGQDLLASAARELVAQDWAALIAAAGAEPGPRPLAGLVALLRGGRAGSAAEDENADWPGITDFTEGSTSESEAEPGSPGQDAEPDADTPTWGSAPDDSPEPPSRGRRF